MKSKLRKTRYVTDILSTDILFYTLYSQFFVNGFLFSELILLTFHINCHPAIAVLNCKNIPVTIPMSSPNGHRLPYNYNVKVHGW